MPDLNLVFVCRNRHRLVVKGVGPIGGSGSQKNPELWKNRLTSVLKLFGPEVDFEIKNVIMYSAGNPVYDVELDSATSVDEILNSSFRFYRRKDPISKPPELEKISIYRSVTPGTRVRISLLRVSSFLYKYVPFNPCLCIN